MSRILYFDLETRYAADEVGGWGNVMDMGMSVGVLYDTAGGEFHVYLEHQTAALIEHLRRADLIVGFNHVEFDLRVLAGHQPTSERRHQLYLELRALNHLDLLQEVKRILGHRLRLESLARPTLAVGKSADGLQALTWYKEGRMDLIIEYCKQDVEVTRRLHEFALEHGRLLYDSRGGIREVALNLALAEPEAVASEQMTLFE